MKKKRDPNHISLLDDDLFKLIFGDQRNIDVTESFLKAFLDIPEDDYDHLTIVNPTLKRRLKMDKSGIVDVRVLTKSGRTIHIELQVNKQRGMKGRIVWYLTRLFGEQMSRGNDYEKLHQVISIVICDHILLDDTPDYLNCYTLRNEKTHTLFTDLIKAYILELPKMPSQDDGTLPWAWGKLLKSTTVREFDELAKNHKELEMAVYAAKFHGPIALIRAYFEERERVRRDMAGIKGAIRDDMAMEIARNLKDMGDPPEKIMKATGLSPEDMAKL